MPFVVERTNGWSADRLRPFWPSVVDCIAKVAASFEEEYTVGSIVEQLLKGERDLWIAHDPDGPPVAFMVLLCRKVVNLVTGRRVLEFSECGGSGLLSALDYLPDIEAWATENGFDAIRVAGRPGWSRALRAHGYTRRIETVEKNLRE